MTSGISFAQQAKVLVSPVNIRTDQSSYSIYPNISDFISNDVINELNKNLRFDVPDIRSAEDLIMSYGLYEDYKNFLKNYKDSGIIDYKMCGLLYEKLGIDKILLISSGFSLQNMILKRPFLYKIGITEVEPIQSSYTLNVEVMLIDTQTCLIDFEKTYEKKLRTKNFEISANSLSDNIVSTKKIKKFSKNISKKIAVTVFTKTMNSAYTKVKSNIISTSNKKNKSKDGFMTRDGHSYSTGNEYLKNKRKENFKNWVKERTNF